MKNKIYRRSLKLKTNNNEKIIRTMLVNLKFDKNPQLNNNFTRIQGITIKEKPINLHKTLEQKDKLKYKLSQAFYKTDKLHLD